MFIAKDKIKVICSEENFPEVEMELFGIEWNEKPNIQYVDVQTEEEIFSYRVKREHDKFYLVSD